MWVESAPLPGGGERGKHSSVWSRQHQAVECSPPRHLILWLLGTAARFQSLFGALKSNFQALPITTNSLLCFIDKPSHFQAAVLPQTKAGSCSAGIGIFRDEHTSSPQWEVNCWCLLGSSSHLWFAPSGKVNPRSWDPPPALKKLMAESHLWGSPRDPELVSFLQTLLSPAWC